MTAWLPGQRSARGKGVTFQTALCVVRRHGYTVTTSSTTPELSALNNFSLHPQNNCATGSVFWKAAAPADFLLTQQGLVPSHGSAFYSSSSGRLT